MSEKVIRKTYVCPIVGTGAELDSRRPKIADVINGISSWFMHELTPNWCLVTVVAPAFVHDLIAFETGVELVLVRQDFVVSSGRLEVLKGSYPKLLEKMNVVLKSSIKYLESDGK